jgi:hypothetical protein
MEQINALDIRIEMLAMDMRMFSGELKVDVMASLLTAMIERQALTEHQMQMMRQGMMRRMPERAAPPPVASVDVEPGGMCAPAS